MAPDNEASLAPPSMAWKGVLCMLGGGVLLVINDAASKWLVEDYPVGEVLFIRGLCIGPLIVLLVWRECRRRPVRRPAFRSQIIRALFVAAVNFLFVAALAVMPLADTIALTFASPLFIALLAGPLLGEVLTWRRWAAVGLGFVGVLLIAQPAGDAVRLAALLPLGAALCGALKDLLTRHMVRTESSLITLLFSTGVTTLVALATAPFGWRMPEPADLLIFAAAGLVMAIAHYLLIEAFRYAEASLVAPLIFVELVWSIIIGYLVWGDIPGEAVFLGALIVVASGMMVAPRRPPPAGLT